MIKTHFKSVDEYMELQPPAVRQVLERVRGTIRKALPGADEVISYNMPAYKLGGRVAIFFAGWKQHIALYPANPALAASLKDELAGYEMSKGTIRFPLSQPIPLRLIARIAKLRAQEIVEGGKARAASAKGR